MAHFGTYGSNRCGVALGSSSYGLAAPSHSTLSPYNRSNDRSPSRPSKTTNLYSSAASKKSWERGPKDQSSTRGIPTLSYDYRTAAYPTDYDRQRIAYQPSRERPTSRASECRIGRTLDRTSYTRPQSSLGHYNLLPESHSTIPRASSPSHRSSYIPSHARTSTGSSRIEQWKPSYKPSVDRPSFSNYTRPHIEDVPRFSAGRFSRTRHSQNTGDGNAKSGPELKGWRAKLAQEGYSASTIKPQKPPVHQRQWNYVDNNDETAEHNFVYLVCQGANTDEEHSVIQPENSCSISRKRKMRLEIIAPIESYVFKVEEIAIQVDVEDLERCIEREKQRSKRTFISSRHCSWYQDGSYNKYVSAVPWRPTSYTRDHWSKSSRKETSQIPSPKIVLPKSTLGNKIGYEIDGHLTSSGIEDQLTPSESEDLDEVEKRNKDFRKSVLNMNLPETEAEVFARIQEETRLQDRIQRRRRSTNSTSTTSGEGSPNETGYESHSSCTDGERIKTPKFMFPKVQTPVGSVKAVPCKSRVEGVQTSSEFPISRSSKGSIEDCTFKPQHEVPTTRVPKSSMTSSGPDGEKLKEVSFRFRSLNDDSSQRDSGFSEIYNRSESPFDNIPNFETDEISSPNNGHTDSNPLEIPQLETTRIEKKRHHTTQKYISDCKDIDIILLGDATDCHQLTFEDFERQFDYEREQVRPNIHSKPRMAPHRWAKPSKVGLRLDLSASDRFIGQCRDIDEMLGKPSPLSPEEPLVVCGTVGGDSSNSEDDGASTIATSVLEAVDVANVAWLDEVDESKVFPANIIKEFPPSRPQMLDDCTLQLYRCKGGEGDYGSYLDLESTVDEQAEDFEGFQDNRKNSVILRTQLSVRVHAIIEKLVNSNGRELRRALFSLKQIFQDDKDLVHEFVQNDGLACLIKVGSEADQNYQNYILRALGQVMLYVDGMNGVIEHNETIQWLYSLISSKYRLVVKTALKLLLVFVEYTESNSQLLMNAVCVVDAEKGSVPWSNIMNLLKEKDSADMELLVYAVTLINKTLNGIPDQDTYYDVVDTLEEQGMEHVIQYYMSKQGTDLDLLQQFQIYEAVLKHEDGVPHNKPLPLDARLRQVPRSRKSCPDDNDRRKSRRHSVGTPNSTKKSNLYNQSLCKTPEETSFSWQDRNQKQVENAGDKTNGHKTPFHVNGNGEIDSSDDVNGITPALRRRRERDARNKSLIKEQESNGRDAVYQRMDSVSSTSSICSDSCENTPLVREDKPFQSIVERRRSCFENNIENENRKNSVLSKVKDDRLQDEDRKTFTKQSSLQSDVNRPSSLPYGRSDSTNKKAWMLSMMYAKSQEDENKSPQHERLQNATSPVEIVNSNYITFNKTRDEDSNLKSNIKRDGSVKDMQEKFMNNNSLRSPTSENIPRLGDTSGIISRAKEGLAASKTRPEQKVSSPTESPTSKFILEPKKVDSDLQWEQLMKSMKRPLVINDLDFTDLKDEEDFDFLVNGDSGSNMLTHNSASGPPPPPLPSGLGPPPPPPPLPLGGGPVPPPPPPQTPQQQSAFTSKIPNSINSQFPSPWMRRNQHHTQEAQKEQPSKTSQKTKKTVKLFWREVKEDQSLLRRIGKKKTIWDELKPIPVDTQKLEHLFENRAKDVMNKEKSQEGNKKNEIIVLDTKRSNAINIGMTKLPPPRTIKTAIIKMDSTIMNREGIEKILTTMLPSEDEKARISEAQMSSPDVPLGTAEQFLLTLSSINELEARLRLWAFRLDYDTMEREVAEPLMDLKQAMKEIEGNETFRVILSTLRSVGNFLNGVEIKGFHIEYLSKVPEVKDTVQKHSLLHHLCHIVMEKFPKSSDLYSEIGAVTRASKVDYAEVSRSLNKMESECKASWDYLKAIAKHDGSITMKVRTSEFLTDCAERIIVLKVIHRRMNNRYHKFLVYLGCTSQSIEEMPIQKVCKVLSEFALEYRTTRERVLQQIEKKANHRERNKTRGKMITDMERFRTKEQQADHELRQLLGNGNINGDDQRIQKWGTVPGVRGRVKTAPGPGGSLGRHSAPAKDENLTDADDEILETLVKTATTQPARNEPRIRKKARYGDRKSLRRTLKSGLDLSEEERHMLSTLTT